MFLIEYCHKIVVMILSVGNNISWHVVENWICEEYTLSLKSCISVGMSFKLDNTAAF